MGSRLEKNSKEVSKRIEEHAFSDEQGEEYGASKFGGFADYMRRKKIKLQNLDANLRAESADKPKIFRGIVVHVNGYTQPSLSDLHNLIVVHGGGFLQYLDGKTACTHIIASQLTPKKKAEFAKYRIVKPAWIVDSVSAGKVLPWENYRVVDEGVTQKVLGFQNGQFVSQTNRQSQSYRGQSDTSWYASQVKGIAKTLDEEHGDQQVASESVIVRPQRADSPYVTPAKRPATLLNEDNEDEESAYDDVNDDETREESVASHIRDLEQLHPKSMPPDLEATPASLISSLNAANESQSAKMISNQEHRGKRPLTAEEHNAILLQNPHMAKSSTANPDFLNQYYRESRLHHLSAWKADLKAKLQARTIQKLSQKSLCKRPTSARRYILHVDFDSFFAAVSLRKHPEFADKPVVIAHGQGSGSEIASCNYPARKFGVKNGMWMKSALAVCPDLKVLPYDFKEYEEASRHFYDAILAIDGIVQSISIDEALVDVSEQCINAGGHGGKSTSEGSIDREQAKAAEIAQHLRASVKEKTDCHVSVGIGNNILLAKVALRKAKPAGQHLIKPDEILDFIGELIVTDLPGVAYSLGKKLEELGVKYVKDIRSLTKERLVNALGPKTGEKLWDYSRGIDRAEVGDQVVRKSVSAEVNWGIRFVTQAQAEEFVQALCDELHKRLLENAVKGKQLTMKIMRKAADAGLDPPKHLGHGKCDTFNKSVILGVATHDPGIIGKEAISILRAYAFSPGELRGLGVQMQKLEPLKPITSHTPTAPESSQKRLQFKKPGTGSDRKNQTQQLAQPAQSLQPKLNPNLCDPIEEAQTPEKLKHSATIIGAIDEAAHGGEFPLNIGGTQFVLPTQIDQTVLNELPSDIRTKLVPKQASVLHHVQRPTSPLSVHNSGPASPRFNGYELPSQSQLDPETIAALPEDVMEELMTHYRGFDKDNNHPNQLFANRSSPRPKVRASSKKLLVTPTKRHKTTNLIGYGRVKSKTNPVSTLTQSSFVSLPKVGARVDVAPATEDEISKSFLDELPEDIRLELLAEQKRNRMKLKSGLDVGSSRQKSRNDSTKKDLLKDQQRLLVPARPEKPTFTSRKLSRLSDLREAMSAWVQEFSNGDEDGPYEEDANALGRYLQKVVEDEEDMAKAVAVIDWLSYLIGDWPFEKDSVRDTWKATIRRLQNTVQNAVMRRQLPPLEFAM